MPLSALIFDFDGTLADSFEATVGIANALAPEFGYRRALPEEFERWRGSSYRHIASELGMAWHRIPQIASRIRQELSHAVADMPTFDGLPEVLSNLRARGVVLGILTSNDRDNVSRFLAARALPHFDFISTSASVWGKERRLKSLLRKQGLSPSEVAYVGDEVRDIEAVKPIGMRMVAVAWGYTAPALLAAHAPDHLIAAPAELLKLPGLPLRPASEPG